MQTLDLNRAATYNSIESGVNQESSHATYLRNQDVVTRSNAHRDLVAIAVNGTGANSEDLGHVLLLDTALGEEDTRGSLGLGLDALDQDTVEERGKVLDVTEDRLYSKQRQTC